MDAADRACMGIARIVPGLPDVAGGGLGAQQRYGGPPAAFLGIVPDLGTLLSSVDGEHGRVEVEDDRGAMPEQLLAQLVVQAQKPLQPRPAEADQESPQRLRIGVGGESREVLKDPVVLEQPRGFDPPQSQHQGVKPCQEGLADGVAVVALVEADAISEQRTQPQSLHEPVQQEKSTEVGERVCREGNLDLAGAGTPHRQNLTQSEVLAQALRGSDFDCCSEGSNLETGSASGLK